MIGTQYSVGQNGGSSHTILQKDYDLLNYMRILEQGG